MVFSSFAATVFFQLYLYRLGYTYNVWYDNGLLMICTVFVMVLFSKTIATKKIADVIMRFFRCLSRDSFGIYLIHMLVMIILKPFVDSAFSSYPIRFVILSVAVFIISWVLVDFVSRIPKIGKILFNMR